MGGVFLGKLVKEAYRRVLDMSKFRPVKVSRVSETIVAQLEELMLEGTLKAGEQLPAERELATTLDVSRPSLREAIVILQARGLLEARRGGGTFVRNIMSGVIPDPIIEMIQKQGDSKFDALEMRSVLEVTAARYAAERRTDSDIELIKQRFADLESHFNSRDPDPTFEIEADVAFHLAIADASHNVVLTHIMRSLINLIRVDIGLNIERLRQKEADHSQLKTQHRMIFEAVIDGDAIQAADAAREHLVYVEQKLREGLVENGRTARANRRLA